MNLALLNDLREVLGWLSDSKIPAIVLKGPALAHLGLGMARMSHDLDVLIRDDDKQHVDYILRRHGYGVLPGPPHDYHKSYRRTTGSGARVLEIHVDIFDRLRSHKPDLAGIWDRSVVTTIFDIPARVPDLSDHLLLTIMQLPHHYWSIRLIVDLWQVVLRWGDGIDWKELLKRSVAWQIGVLTRSTLHALESMFGVPIAPEVIAMSSPVSYFERLQWLVARHAIAEQLEYPLRPKIMWLAPFLLADDGRVPSILMMRLVGAGGSPEEGTATKAFRRNISALFALPSIGRLVLSSMGQSALRRGWPK